MFLLFRLSKSTLTDLIQLSMIRSALNKVKSFREVWRLHWMMHGLAMDDVRSRDRGFRVDHEIVSEEGSACVG